MSPQPDYQVIGKPIQQAQFSEALQSYVQGFKVTVRDGVTGGILSVFIPEDVFTPDNARTAIEAALAPYRAVAQIGHNPAPAA